ncbi:MAG: cation-translocating P-type ATPase [Chitinophagales bacterium]
MKELIKLNVQGMTCTNCARGVENLLKDKNARDINVNFSTDEVEFSIGKESKLEEIKNGIEKLGYIVNSEGETIKVPWWSLNKKFTVSLILTIPLLLHMFLPFELLHNPIFQLTLSTPVFLIGLHHFGGSSLGALKSGVANMDVLILLGSSAAFIYSLYGTIIGQPEDFLFYETAATIITLVLMGNIIERRSVQQTTTAIKELSKLKAEKANLIQRDHSGNEEIVEINAKDIESGQTFLVKDGERVPADGKVYWGEALVNESMVTGESKPILKKINDTLLGGTLLEDGNIKMTATSIGNQSFLGRIIRLVKNAQADKPQIQRMADQVSAIFVPLVVGIAILTFALSFWLGNVGMESALLRSIAVLAISCPCAMGLATPTAVMVGVGRVTKNGVLIKGGTTIEKFSEVKQIVFDKTGTLTSGAFKIKKLLVWDNEYSEDEIKSIIAGLEKYSGHPIAKSLQKELSAVKAAAFSKVKEIKGIGIDARSDAGDRFSCGSKELLKQKPAPEDELDVYLLKNGTPIAGIVLEDEIKKDAAETIDFLKSKGIKTILLSGDRKANCISVAERLGIDTVYYEKKPDEKLKIIEELNAQQSTAMVGDGINDAPALNKAMLGISLNDATQIAMDSSDIILLNGKLSGLIEAYKISRGTFTTIKQNLFWAFAYNIVAIPIAALGFLNPMVAALSMAFSDVVVVGNSLRLRSRKLR